MAVDLQGLAKVLEASLDPTQNKQGLLPIFSRLSTVDLNLVYSGACYLKRGEEAQLLAIATSYRSIRFIQWYRSTS